MANKLDSRQSVQRPLASDTRNTLDQLSNSTGLRLDTILNLINDELTPPLRIRVDPTTPYKILIESNQITTSTSTDSVGTTVGHSRKKTSPPINGTIPTFPSNASLTIPSELSSGTGTITGTNITIENQTITGQYGTPSFTIGTDNHYIKMAVSLRSNGNIVLTFGNSAILDSNATLPSPIADIFPIGFVLLRRSSSTSLYQPTDSDVYQFSANTNTLSVDSSVNRIYKANHLFVVGNALYYNSSTGYYEKAQANVSNTSNVVGMVSKVVDTNNFELTTNGRIAGITSQTLTAGSKYYLSTTSAGQIVSSAPTVAGTQTVELGTALDSSTLMLSIKNNYTTGEISNFQSPNIRTQINLSGSSSITQTTTIKDVSGYDAGEIVGWVFLDAATDYRFYISATFVKLANGSFSLTPSSSGDTPPVGYSLSINSVSGVVSLTLPAMTGWNSGYIVYAINAPAVGTSFPLSINQTDVILNYREVSSSYAAVSSDFMIVATGSSSLTITLPAISGSGKQYIIKSMLTSGNVTIQTTGGALIDTVTSKTLLKGESIRVISDSVKWINVLTPQSFDNVNISSLTASKLIQSDSSKNLTSAGFSVPSTAGTNLQFLSSNGDGTSSWRTSVYNATQTGTAIDASTGNSFIQNGTGTPRTITVTNLADGQTINIQVQGAGGNVISWTVTGIGGTPTLTQKTGATYSNTMASANSIYTFIRLGTNVFINSLHGFG